MGVVRDSDYVRCTCSSSAAAVVYRKSNVGNARNCIRSMQRSVCVYASFVFN